MRKLILASLLFASAVQAQTFTCNSFDVYQGTGNGNYKQVYDTTNHDADIRLTITTSTDKIVVSVDNSDIKEGVFWKDYNEYRNDDGKIIQNGNNFTVLTAVPVEDTNVFVPIKIEYHCK